MFCLRVVDWLKGWIEGPDWLSEGLKIGLYELERVGSKVRGVLGAEEEESFPPPPRTEKGPAAEVEGNFHQDQCCMVRWFLGIWAEVLSLRPKPG